MVMKRNAMRRNLLQSIKASFGRYIAIVAIIALGSAMFVGLLMTKSDMVETGDRYARAQNMFDLRLVSSFGWTSAQVEKVRALEGVQAAEGLYYQDLVVHPGSSTDERVYRFYAIPESINQISLRGGRMPEKPDECLADGYGATDAILGTTVTIAENNEGDSAENLRYRTYTVVGYCASPLYFDRNRGTTTVGNGSLSGYVFVPREAFDLEIIPEIHVTFEEDYPLYSDAYNDAMDALAEQLEPQLEPMVEERRLKVKGEAEDSYREGLLEYYDGVLKFRQGRHEARRELEDARQQLLDAETEIAENEQKLKDGERQLAEGRRTLSQSETMLRESRKLLESMKAFTLQELQESEAALNTQIAEDTARLRDLDAQIAALDQKLAALNGQMGSAKQELDAIDSRISQLNSSIASADASITVCESLKASMDPSDEAQIAQMDAQIAALQAQRAQDASELSALQAARIPLAAQLEGPLAEYNAISAQRQQLQTDRTFVQISLDSANASLQTVRSSIENIDAQFAPMEQQLAEGEAELASGYRQLAQSQRDLEEGKQALEDAKIELEQGWKDYGEGVLEVSEELAEGEQKLTDARRELADARDLIDSMTENTVFILDRNSNLGYSSLESASDIVQGVARVFPAFFLLVAALVCITTMTRMIEEERTEIGTLKALGYSNGAIISKYLIYAGSGAVIGCGLGVLVGSGVFPTILWEVYKIMLYITDDVVLQINWPLCFAVVGTYTTVMLLVTWYCCRRALQEVPAELIRPKAPDPGKKIFLERLPIWQRVSFLNKVTIRNMFRYRQRLAMMIVGIGGCTALLVTGFGLRDSIVNVVDFQFDSITTYDMTVHFTEGQTQEAQREFLTDVRPYTRNAVFYHQSSIELEVDKQVKEIYLIAGDEKLQQFIDMHTGSEPIPMPRQDEVVLSVGVASVLGVRTGDQIQLRDADLRTLELTVSGIYDNHVNNYAIICPETISSQWGEQPEMQMAFLQIREDQDAHEVSTHIAELDGVMNVSVSEDLATMVRNLMKALDLVVVVIVVCAGFLAAIVLYNLTNININERIREIATIKVLGFRAEETAAYVFKENLSLTAIGSLLGLGMGYALLLFVMSQIKIDMVWFSTVVMPPSYFWALGLTLLSACVVDFIFYFKLDKINMAEALKSVE